VQAMAILRGCKGFGAKDLAVPFVYFGITYLAYSSQFCFHFLPPGPLNRTEAVWFNISLLCLWWTYYQARNVDPGRKGWVNKVALNDGKEKNESGKLGNGIRWCKKCEAVKPPRAHHCKTCRRCIPKMDHHCPWTKNCVSYTTFPHFIRFVFYCVLSMSMMEYYVITRAMILWEKRNLPYYLGPSTTAMAHLLIVTVFNTFTLFLVSILLIRTIYGLCTNTSQIEYWEIERHETLVARARKRGGWVYAAGGGKIRVEKQEFPYDVGIWKNICQGMGTSNVFMWFAPWAGGPSELTAGSWEENGFEDEGKLWPPLDPDKLGRAVRKEDVKENLKVYGSVEEEKEAFRKRQEQDMKRWQKEKRSEGNEANENENEDGEEEYESEYEEGLDGEEGWTNSEGERLRDYGVDEDAAEELHDDDDIPLGELIRRRKAAKAL